MKNFFKIAIRILPVFAILLLAYLFYLNFYGDRSQLNWLGGKNQKSLSSAESEKVNNFIKDYRKAYSALNNFSTDNTDWINISESQQEKIAGLNRKTLNSLRDSFKSEALDSLTLMRFRKLEYELILKNEAEKFRDLEYFLNPVNGYHLRAADNLYRHEIKTEADASDYLKKLKKISVLADQLVSNLERSEKSAALPPRFYFSEIILQLDEISGSFPAVRTSRQNALLADFSQKLSESKIPLNRKNALKDSCISMLKLNIAPSFEKLKTYLRKTEHTAQNSSGIWKMKEGEDFYAFLLKKYSGTDLSAIEVYELGMEEIEKTHSIISELLKKQGINKDSRQYLEQNRSIQTSVGLDHIVKMQHARSAFIDICPELFGYCPSKDSFKFYQSKNQFDLNLYSSAKNGLIINQFGIYSAEICAFAESFFNIFPGISYLDQLQNNPNDCNDFHSFTQGWSLYACHLAEEMSLYSDFRQKLGYYYFDLMQSCHLVADAAVHSKKWTKDQAVQFYRNNVPFSPKYCTYIVDYICTNPGRLTAAKIGMLTIKELRNKAQASLKEKFLLREFHHEILKNGCIPLSFLEDITDEYIRKKGAK